jgi:hypothetical protein
MESLAKLTRLDATASMGGWRCDRVQGGMKSTFDQHLDDTISQLHHFAAPALGVRPSESEPSRTLRARVRDAARRHRAKQGKGHSSTPADHLAHAVVLCAEYARRLALHRILVSWAATAREAEVNSYAVYSGVTRLLKVANAYCSELEELDPMRSKAENSVDRIIAHFFIATEFWKQMKHHSYRAYCTVERSRIGLGGQDGPQRVRDTLLVLLENAGLKRRQIALVVYPRENPLEALKRLRTAMCRAKKACKPPA